MDGNFVCVCALFKTVTASCSPSLAHRKSGLSSTAQWVVEQLDADEPTQTTTLPWGRKLKKYFCIVLNHVQPLYLYHHLSTFFLISWNNFVSMLAFVYKGCYLLRRKTQAKNSSRSVPKKRACYGHFSMKKFRPAAVQSTQA